MVLFNSRITWLEHSHKKRKDSLETRAVFSSVLSRVAGAALHQPWQAQVDFDALKTIIDCFICYIMKI